MIYLDTSVALAALFAEARRPADAFWQQPMVSSRLIEYEMLVRINARGLPADAVKAAGVLVEGIDVIELDRGVLTRMTRPFPTVVRTLDAIHVATMDYLRAQGLTLELATYDARLAAAAGALGFALASV